MDLPISSAIPPSNLNNACIRSIRLGTDLIQLSRLEGWANRHGLKIFQRLLTPTELAYCLKTGKPLNHGKTLQRLGGRLAIKEAVAKALGVGMKGLGHLQGIHWQSIEVQEATQTSPPSVKLHKEALKKAESIGVTQWSISLSHDGDIVSATALGCMLC